MSNPKINFLPVLMRLIFIGFLLVSFPLTAQDIEEKTRTREVDYTQYDQLMAALPYAGDKIKASKNLLSVSDKLFTEVDEEYFTTRKMVAIYFEQGGELFKAYELIQQAIQAYEKNYPFYNRGYSTLNDESILLTYLELSRLHRSQNLFEKNIKYLESKTSVLETSSAYYIRQMFYSEMGHSLIGAEQYAEAVKSGLQLKELTESGALKMSMQSADELFKINDDYPQETKDQMLKAKADYIKTMAASQEAVLSSQRLNYNTILSQAYFNQYLFEDAIPYARALVDEMNKMMAYSKSAMQTAQQQMKDSPYLADSIKQQVSQGAEYMKQVSQVGGSATQLVIAASKANQKPLAVQYANGAFEKAVLLQLNHDFVNAEKQYQLAFSMLQKLSAISKLYSSVGKIYRKGFLPFYLNLQVQDNRLAEAYKESKNLIETEEKLVKASFQFFSENEKKEFFKSYTQKLNRYYSLLMLMTEKGNERTGEILDKIFQTKGVILDATREQERQLRKLNDKVALAQVAEIKRLRDKLTSYYQLSLKNPTSALADSINTTSIRINDLERTVNKKLGATSLLKPVSWQQIQMKLKKEEVYFEIIRLERDYFEFDKPIVQYWGFVIKPGETKPSMFLISESEAFDGRGLKNYQNRMRGLLEDTESYQLYWAKISKQAGGAKTIFLSGDGVYHIVNPLTLQNPATGKYVLDEITVRPVSTGRDFLIDQVPQLANSVVLVGNPIFDMNRKEGSNAYRGNEVTPVEADETTRSGIARLPGTQKEIDLIEELAVSQQMKTQVLSESEATESKVKSLQSPGILHLATHGEFDQLTRVESYLKSKLILAGAADSEPFSMDDYARYEDGFLTAYEVTQLVLTDTRLVVLSACETGLGEIQNGEGVWGLQRAFQLAGAQSIMGSLWKISDEATVTFMETFYQTYFEQKDLYAAYFKAMQVTRNQYSHPYFWGAFTLSGIN
jgi:hypothetical protein